MGELPRRAAGYPGGGPTVPGVRYYFRFFFSFRPVVRFMPRLGPGRGSTRSQVSYWAALVPA